MTERIVIDTDVISILLKDHSRAASYSAELDGKQWVVSFMTIAELRLWALKRRWGSARAKKLDLHLLRVAVYTVDLDLCQKWAEVRMEAILKGRQISVQDAWIAATALQMRLPLVTNNAKDFEGVSGLTVITHQ